MKMTLGNLSIWSTLLFCQATYANPTGLLFNIVSSGKTLNITPVKTNHTYPTAGIKINTAGYNITSGCTLNSNGYCLFSASARQPTVLSFSGPVGTINVILCLNGLGPLSCQYYDNISVSPTPTPPIPAVARFAYIADNGVPGVIKCTVDASTGAFINCGATGSIFNNPSAITLNNAGTLAYVGNYGDGSTANAATFCSIDPTTGELMNCATTPAFGAPFIGTSGITLNPAGTYAYVSSVQPPAQYIYKCSIDSNTGELTTCSPTGTGYGGPAGIAFNAAGTLAYVTDYYNGSSVTKCPVDATTGEFGSCTATGSGAGATFDYPYAIVLNTAKTKSYVTNYNGQDVSLCNIDSNTSELTDCIFTTDISSPSFIPFGFTINRANTFAYIGASYGDNTVYQCTVNALTGSLSGCISTGSDFVSPYGIVLSY